MRSLCLGLAAAVAAGTLAFADPAAQPSPLQDLITQTRLRAQGFAGMAQLPAAPDALEPAQSGLDDLAQAAGPVKSPKQAKAAFQAAMARAKLVARHPASPQDLADALDSVAEAGQALLAPAGQPGSSAAATPKPDRTAAQQKIVSANFGALRSAFQSSYTDGAGGGTAMVVPAAYRPQAAHSAAAPQGVSQLEALNAGTLQSNVPPPDGPRLSVPAATLPAAAPQAPLWGASLHAALADALPFVTKPPIPGAGGDPATWLMHAITPLSGTAKGPPVNNYAAPAAQSFSAIPTWDFSHGNFTVGGTSRVALPGVATASFNATTQAGQGHGHKTAFTTTLQADKVAFNGGVSFGDRSSTVHGGLNLNPAPNVEIGVDAHETQAYESRTAQGASFKAGYQDPDTKSFIGFNASVDRYADDVRGHSHGITVGLRYSTKDPGIVNGVLCALFCGAS